MADTDPTRGPTPPNQQKMPPRLYKATGATRLAIRRDHHLDGTIPTYWGPQQDGPGYADDGSLIYMPPANWPRKGTLLRVPRVARWFWEAADVDYEVVIAMGPTGGYIYGQHFLDFATDISTPPGIFPVHISGHALDQHGVSLYGTSFTISGSGRLDVIDGSFIGSYHYTYNIYTNWLPPISLKQYEDPTSATYEAVKEAWEIVDLNGNYTGVPAFTPAPPFGDPPMDMLQDGPKSVGVTDPVKTGVYFINGVQYGTRVDLNTLPMAIPDGWHPPTDPDMGQDSSSNWGDLQDKLTQAYKGSTNPYFDVFPRTFGMDKFLDLVTPTDDGFFACNTVNFILLSVPHPVPSMADARISRIIDVFPNMATYRVVIMVDTQNISEQAQAGLITANGFVDEISKLCVAMAPYGWFFEPVSYLKPDHVADLIHQYIKEHLHPELKDAPPDDRDPMNTQGSDDGQGDGGFTPNTD